MSRKEATSTIVADATICTGLRELHHLRDQIKTMVAQEKELARLLLDYAGPHDGIAGDGVDATVARCEGNVSWKDVAEQLSLKYDVPPSVMLPLLESSRGAPYNKLILKLGGK